MAADRAYAVNGLNQYSSVAGANYGYDANGNLTSDGINSYVYDAENRLVSSSRAGGTTLSYDPLGRLWQTSSPTYGTTQFVYDGDHVALEYTGTGAIQRRFVWGPGADEPILQDEGSALNCTGTRFLHADHQGSIIATADCSGNRQNVNSYDENGVPGANNWGRFQYTGQAWIPDLGMYYYKARMYSPMLGRFMQTDPIGYKDQINLYEYVGDDPVNNADPSGMCFESSCPVGSGDPHADQLTHFAEQGRDANGQPILTTREMLWAGFTGLTLGIAPEAYALRGLGLAGRIASSSFPRAFAVLDRVSGGLARTAGSSGQRTFQAFMSGGKAAAERLFSGLTRGSSDVRGAGRLGQLGDGSRVQMSTRTLRDGTVQTDVRISRTYTPTGSLIQRTENIKIRFQEKP